MKFVENEELLYEIRLTTKSEKISIWENLSLDNYLERSILSFN